MSKIFLTSTTKHHNMNVTHFVHHNVTMQSVHSVYKSLDEANFKISSYNRYINERVKVASNCRASDGNAIRGSWKIKHKPVNTGMAPMAAAILRILLLVVHLVSKLPAQVLPMIFIPSVTCNTAHPTRPPYRNQLRQCQLCRPNFTNSKSSIDESDG